MIYYVRLSCDLLPNKHFINNPIIYSLNPSEAIFNNMAKSTSKTVAKTSTSLTPLALLVIDALEEIKARDILMLDVTHITSVCDFVVITSADSTRQTKALARNVLDRAREAGHSVVGLEGEQAGEWVLVDLGDIVIHILQPVAREYYNLEERWAEGRVVFPVPVGKKVKAATTVDDVLARKEKNAPAAEYLRSVHAATGAHSGR